MLKMLSLCQPECPWKLQSGSMEIMRVSELEVMSPLGPATEHHAGKKLFNTFLHSHRNLELESEL